MRKNSKNASPLNTLYSVESEAIHAEALLPQPRVFYSKIMHFIHMQFVKWKKQKFPEI